MPQVDTIWYPNFHGKVVNFLGQTTQEFKDYSKKKEWFRMDMQHILEYLAYLEKQHPNLFCKVWFYPEHDECQQVNFTMILNGKLYITRSHSLIALQDSYDFEQIKWEINGMYYLLLQKEKEECTDFGTK